MDKEKALVTFEKHPIRRFFDEAQEMWYFSVVDVVAALTDSVNPRDYWFKMKIRVNTEDGLELSTICRQLKMKAPDGKMRETDCADVEGLFLSLLRTWKRRPRARPGAGNEAVSRRQELPAGAGRL